MEPLVVNTMLQSKLETEIGILEEYLQLNVVQKGMLVNSTPKLTHSEEVKEQHEDSDIEFCNPIVQNRQSGKICGLRNGFLRKVSSFKI